MDFKFIPLILMAGLLQWSTPAFSQTQYFVSSHSPHNTADGSREAPFHSISAALDKARQTPDDVRIYLREGTYRLTHPLVLTAQDGHERKKLTLQAFPGEKVVLTSSLPLSLTWEKFRKGIWKATVVGDPILDVLYVNGQLRHMARYPNVDSTAVRFQGTSRWATDPSRVRKWKNPQGGYLHAMHLHDWGDFHYQIISKTQQGELELSGGWQNNRPMGLHEHNRMVENIWEELDAPGEWYYRKEDHTLFYYPYAGENPSELLFETPQLKQLIEIRGTEEQPACHITLEGLELTQTLRTFMEAYEPLLRSDWRIYRGAAVFLEGTEHCVLRNCSLYQLGGNAVFLSRYNRSAVVSGNHITQIGASAVCLVGDTSAVRSPSFEYRQSVPYLRQDLTKGPKNRRYPSACQISDNLIHAIGLFEKQVAGIQLSMAQSIVVSHNSIYDTPRAGINISEGTWGGHVIEYNDVFNTVRETGDHGAFNAWGRDRFWHPDYATMEEWVARHPTLVLTDAVKTTVIRNNRFRCDRGWDIDLDDGSSNYHIYNNLCLNGGIKLREGFYRIVENNILVNNTFHPHVWFLNSGDIFTRNLVMMAYQPIGIRNWGCMVDYNIFTDSLSLAATRSYSIDTHSIIIGPKFKNPRAGDFSVADDSEAITLGWFRNFDMNQFGVLSPELKEKAQTPPMPVPLQQSTNSPSEVIHWNGLRIKSLQTLGERSATGMDTERGIYVISIDALESRLRDYLCPNDVILKVGNTPVNHPEELLQVMQRTRQATELQWVIFRNQHEMTLSIPCTPKPTTKASAF